MRAFVLAVVVAAAVGAGCTSTSPAPGDQSSRPEVTSVRTFEPFSPDGINSDITIADEGSGECFGASLSTPRDDAWRCFLGNVIHDPCFASPFELRASRVACPDVLAPSPKHVILINLEERLPRFSGPVPGPTQPTPFLFQLASGATCSWITGATATIGGMRINGGCSDGTSWVGDIDRSEAQWTVQVLREDQSETAREVISVAWL